MIKRQPQRLKWVASVTNQQGESGMRLAGPLAAVGQTPDAIGYERSIDAPGISPRAGSWCRRLSEIVSAGHEAGKTAA